MPARLIPQGKLHPVPESKLVVDHAQIILHDMFRRADSVGHVAVFQALGDKLDDLTFPLAGDASFTRLIPPVIPKRRNSRLK